MKKKKREMALAVGFFYYIFILLCLLGFSLSIAETKCQNAVIFNFGDSNSDTGGLVAGLGFQINLPNGRTFFNRSNGRLCDGRLVLDFLCESLKTGYLRPYLESLGPSFKNGANFAIIGSATQPRFVPFSLDVQVLQFLRFRARSLELTSLGERFVVDEEGFKNALYTFDIGQNDIANAFTANSTLSTVVLRIPAILKEISAAIEAIYEVGGKNFWIHNTGPLGCLPQKLSLFGKGSSSDFDPYGCLKSFNDAAVLLNRGMGVLCDELRSQLKNATIVCVDMYSIKYDLIANFAKYGFENPLMACCGYGGAPYNYNVKVTCGQAGYNVCNQGSKYISWDGVHYSEAANAFIASKILSTHYSTPPLNFDYFCHP